MDLMQAQTEPKLHPETANMEFEQVITKRSATLKGDLKVNLEPKWFLRRFPWKFHVSDFRATLLFTSYCAHILRDYSGSRSVVGKELKPKHLQEKVVTYFSICVGFRVRRTTFQSKPRQAENLTAKREKASDMKG